MAATYHHGDLRAQLIYLAESAVDRLGPESVSLRDLAKAAGVSHGAPRQHFRTRQELLDVVAERGFQRLRDLLVSAVDAAGDRFDKRAHAVAQAYVAFGVRQPRLLALMTAADKASPDEGLQTARTAAFAVFTHLIPQGQLEGLVATGDVDEVGVPFFAAVHGTAVLLAAGSFPADRAHSTTRTVVEHALRGLAPVPAAG